MKQRLCGEGDALVGWGKNRHRCGLQQRRYATDVIGVVVGDENCRKLPLPLLQCA